MSTHYYATNALEGMRPGQTVEQFMADNADVERLIPDAVVFNTVDWYDVLGKSVKMDEVIERCWEAMAEFDPTHRIKISADEWGAFEKGTALSPLNLRGRPVTLRDAVAAALTLDIFNKHADKLLLALFTGLINQEGGLFQAEGARFVATPIYYVFQLYAAHQGGRSLRTAFDTPAIRDQKGAGASLRMLSGSASIRDHQLTLSVVNSHVSEPAEAEIVIRGGDVISGTVATLTHVDIHAQNTFDVPERVRPATSKLPASGSTLKHVFPAASVTSLTLNLRGAGPRGMV
jgi:alpha-N-arabinofuranosidase